ncbi:MAG: DUF4955 domain-containing protein, partial [Candidatus Latescibacteria bacterium]|nr:DUF4955 domain-containing protein [Candidatus Latescibacterota bacterium]
MKFMVGILLTILCAYNQAVGTPVQTLTTCENLSGWPSSGQLAPDAPEGNFAVTTTMPAGQTGFFSYDFRSTGLDISGKHSVGFWWKVEGFGLQDLKIKIRNYPLVGGMEAVYTIWSGQTPPEGWQLAVVNLSKPQFDNWGGEPNLERRYITFRTVTSANANVRLSIDHIVAVDQTFSWQVNSPQLQTESIDHLDFDGDGSVAFGDFILFVQKFGTTQTDSAYDTAFDLNSDGTIGFSDFLAFAAGFGSNGIQWYVPVTLENHTAAPLSIELGSDTQTLSAQTIQAGITEVKVPISTSLLAGRDTSDTFPVPIWAQVSDFVHTRQNWISYLPQNGPSRTWGQFTQAKQLGTEPILPDFSYSGYHYFAKPIPDVQSDVFDVTTYGAIPNDNLSDQTGIQRAIDDAERNGGGIVFFPPGEFLVNTSTDNNQVIYIRNSNVILRGSGSRQGGTIIRQVNLMPPTNPDQLWTSPYMFIFQPLNPRDPVLTRITENATRETFWITVEDASALTIGQWITLYMSNISAVEEFLDPYPAEPIWTTMYTNGIQVREKHSIAEIQGNRIRLNEPLHTHINRLYSWTVRTYQHLEEIGVEDISFHGSWTEEFVHHKDAIHDGGWSLLQLNRCVNSWVRRTSFINCNRALHLGSSSAISVYHITQAGNKGHSSIASSGGYGVWVGLSEDLSGHHHGPGTSSRSVGTVYWRYDMRPNQRIDAHGAQPYANLLDRVNGGILYGSGASIENFPNHLKHYVLWNFKHAGNLTHYDFWRPGSARDRFVQPIVVGFHGDPV